eukprot:6786636-Prymnesium_polylepis.2
MTRALLLAVLPFACHADYYGPAPKRFARALGKRPRASAPSSEPSASVWHELARRRKMDAVVNPFANNNTRAFVFDDDVEGEWSLRSAAAMEHPIQAARLAEAGVNWNSVAMSFKPGFDYSQPLMGDIKAGLLKSSRRGLQNNAIDAILAGDHYSATERPPLPAEHAHNQPFLDKLRTDGFFKIDQSWGLRSKISDDAREEVKWRLGNDDFGSIRKHTVGRGDWNGDDGPIPGIDELKDHIVPTISAIARSYLGEDSDYNNGYVALRLPARQMWQDEYISGLWHHDGCSNRIKCFVFLTEVTGWVCDALLSQNHETARGTHRPTIDPRTYR